MVRAVRDRRFKYIRNYRPDLPYLGWIPYRNRHPILQELWRLHLEGRAGRGAVGAVPVSATGRRAVRHGGGPA